MRKFMSQDIDRIVIIFIEIIIPGSDIDLIISDWIILKETLKLPVGQKNDADKYRCPHYHCHAHRDRKHFYRRYKLFDGP